MPLRCVDDQGQSIQSHLLDDSQWADLKFAQAVRKHLQMACCQQGVVLKTSKLGTNFFAHQRRGECTTKPEGAEHLMLKCLVAKAIEQCGWSVATEVRGQSDQGEYWIADVLASRGRSRVAVEIQWSRQSTEDTYARQARYQGSGVRGLWLFKQADYPVDAAVPAMRVSQDDQGAFVVTIPGCQTKVLDGVPYQIDTPVRIGVTDFIQHAFNGHFWFGLHRAGTTIQVTLLGAFVKCWKCGEWTNVVSKVQMSSADTHQVLDFPLHELPSISILMEQLPLELGIRDRKIGRITRRCSKTDNDKYLANGCFNCNALQSRYFLQEVSHRLKPIYSKTFVVSHEFERCLREHFSDLSCWRIEESLQIQKTYLN